MIHAVLLALSVAACGRAADRPVQVRRVRARVDVVTFGAGGGQLRQMPSSRAEWVVRRAARGSERLRRLPVDAPGWLVTAQALLELDPGRGEGRATATITIERPSLEWAVRAARSAQGSVEGASDRRLLEEALGKALGAAASLEWLRRSPPERLRAALSTEDPERLVVAARAIGERRRSEDVPALVPLLRHSSNAVREAATGALVALGDRSSVRALIEADDENDPLVTIRTVDAVAALGGVEALAYVELIATGHALETVRRTAHQARRRMIRGDRLAEGR